MSYDKNGSMAMTLGM